MNHRASFITGHLVCEHCFHALHRIFVNHGTWTGRQVLDRRIVAGCLRHDHQGGLSNFETDVIPFLNRACCHHVRIAVIATDGAKILTVTPTRKPVSGRP